LRTSPRPGRCAARAPTPRACAQVAPYRTLVRSLL
jgi:hypothetical protein